MANRNRYFSIIHNAPNEEHICIECLNDYNEERDGKDIASLIQYADTWSVIPSDWNGTTLLCQRHLYVYINSMEQVTKAYGQRFNSGLETPAKV